MLIEPLRQPFDTEVIVPGSKSITNRALIIAGQAAGISRISNSLIADDTEAMLDAIMQFGATASRSDDGCLTIRGAGPSLAPGTLHVDARLSGTTARFVAPLAARRSQKTVLDAAPQMRARPMAQVATALRSAGCRVSSDGLPMEIVGPMRGGSLTIEADVTSQFASGLLLAAPGLAEGLDLTLSGSVVSQSYLKMTVAVMDAFGAKVEQRGSNRFVVDPDARYVARDFDVEPDASAASYFFAAAAISGSRVRIGGLGKGAIQGDMAFVDVLARMGAHVEVTEHHVQVTGPNAGRLTGVDVDMRDMSDTAQTLAAIAPFASSPTRVRGIGFIRKKETDRVAAVVTELRRMGITVAEFDDGFLVEPGIPVPARIETYDDHRMAMSFAVTGLGSPGIDIVDPKCVVKTFPNYWKTLDSMRRSG